MISPPLRVIWFCDGGSEWMRREERHILWHASQSLGQGSQKCSLYAQFEWKRQSWWYLHYKPKKLKIIISYYNTF
jgi:hypothetical protein